MLLCLIQIQKRIPLFLFFFCLLLAPARAEKISLRLSLNSYSISEGDIDSWIKSYNSLWRDWQAKYGGSLQGQFDILDFSPTYEAEIRIPLISGFALNFGGSTLGNKKEGTVSYQNEAGSQKETHFLLNEVKAISLKIGLSFTFPVYDKFSLLAKVGRQLIFVRYSAQENYDALFKSYGMDFSYWYKKSNNFHSEGLGFHASLGVEYSVFDFMAIGIEAEKIWLKVNGFKGSHSYQNYYGDEESGKASLYFYQRFQEDLNEYYPVLSGHPERPESASTIRDLRQGELNFNGFSLKIGLRFMF